MVTMESLSRNRHRVVDRSSMQSGLVILFLLDFVRQYDMQYVDQSHHVVAHRRRVGTSTDSAL